MNTTSPSGEFKDAIRLLQQYSALINAGKTSAKNYLNRGKVHQQLRMLEAALRDYAAALAKTPTRNAKTHALIYNLSNICQRELGRYQEAVVAGYESVRLAPRMVDYQINLALSCYGAGDYEGALSAASNALQLNPDNSELWSLRGWSNYQLGDFAAAHADFSESIATDNNVRSYLGRGLVYRALDDEAAARADFDQYIALHPAGPGVASNEVARYLGN